MGVNVQISGIVWDKFDKAGRPVTIVGEMSTEIGAVPPPGGGEGGKPPGIWGGPIDPYPGHPLPEPPGGGGGKPPSIWGGPIDPYPGHPLPPVVPLPPDTPNVPPPGSPPQIMVGTQPINPIVPPDAVLMEYPGIGKVIVPKPVST